MKKYISLFILISVLMNVGFYSCTNSHEDDIILYVPKQVREIANLGEATERVEVRYLHTYDYEGRIKTEVDGLYTAALRYSSENMLESVSWVYTLETVDSIRRTFTHNGGSIGVEQITFKRELQQVDTVEQEIVVIDTAVGAITLNAQQLPQSYTIGNTEERYSYDAESKLITAELYEDARRTKTYSYGYSYDNVENIKSPYSEVPYYAAWYFVVYRHISPVGLITKETVEENGLPAKATYELSNFTLSDSLFITHAIKTYNEDEGTREVVYRQDYQKVVFD